MHFAVHRHTAAELIVERADVTKEHMGLTTWENAPDGKILKADVAIAKNYLNKEKMNYLERIVSLYLDYKDRLYESDFDRFLMLEQEVNHKDEA